MSNNLWVDGTHLTNLGNARLAKVFVNEVNTYQGKKYYFSGEFYLVDFEAYYNILANEETPPYDCNSFNDSEKHLSNSCEHGS